jgi:hypothetical protein
MIVGVTGHQRFESAKSRSWAEEQLRDAIVSNPVTSGLTSLADGTDQIFAKCLAASAIPFDVVVPSKDYELAFASAESLAAYRYFLHLAHSVEFLPFEEPSEEAFLEAGKTVASRSDLLLAVWDGKPAKGLGGAADVVAFARAQGIAITHFNPLTRQISYSR